MIMPNLHFDNTRKSKVHYNRFIKIKLVESKGYYYE
ncbi:Uncharacterised protein [uncultured Clostridium sp.]|nr:Uncharacterised protein [uncultured Clostridium sp.]